MNRRDFLVRASLSVAALAIDPELLVWRPRQMIAVPAMPVVRRVTMAELAAVVYDRILIEREKDGQLFWSDRAMIRQFARDAVLNTR